MNSSTRQSEIKTLRWVGDVDGYLRLIDQTRLPVELVEIDCRDVETLWKAIRQLQIRGAPAIGIAAAYGVCLGIQPAIRGDEKTFFEQLEKTVAYLATSRPTAVNLFWALSRMNEAAEKLRGKRAVPEIAVTLLSEANAVWEEDRTMCRAIGQYGATLLADGQSVLTHCNAGALVTVDYGTALAPFSLHTKRASTCMFLSTKRGRCYRVRGLPLGNFNNAVSMPR